MHLTVYRNLPVGALRPGDRLLRPEGDLIVDEVRLRRDAVEILGLPVGATHTRRTSMIVPHGSAVRVSATDKQVDQVLDCLSQALGMATQEWESRNADLDPAPAPLWSVQGSRAEFEADGWWFTIDRVAPEPAPEPDGAGDEEAVKDDPAPGQPE